MADGYEYKQVLVLRTDLKMRRGKEIAQGAHASMKAMLDFADHEYTRGWLAGPFAKIAVGADSPEELVTLYHKAKDLGLPHALIMDAGRTEFAGVETMTALAVGPGPVAVVDRLTGHLKLR